VPEGAGAGSGDDGRPGGPARLAGASAEADTGPVEIGPLYVDKRAVEPPRDPLEAGALEAGLCEDLPTLPPAPAGAIPALRWAQVEQPPLLSPNLTGPQGENPATTPAPTEQSFPEPVGAAPPGGRARPQPRETYRSQTSAGRPSAGQPSAGRPGPGAPGATRGISPRAPSTSPRLDVPTQPLPVARTQAMSATSTAESVQPTAAIIAPERRHRRGRALFWLLAVVVVIAASASAAIVLAGREASQHLHVSRASPGEVLFEQLMATSATAQGLTATAVARSCTDAAPGAMMRGELLVDLSRAIGLRQSVLSSLEADRTELLGIPNGALLVNDLNAATVAELTVDQDDQGWLEDLQATGCYSAPTNDIHYRAAGLDGPVAAGADMRLAHAWALADPPAH